LKLLADGDDPKLAPLGIRLAELAPRALVPVPAIPPPGAVRARWCEGGAMQGYRPVTAGISAAVNVNSLRVASAASAKQAFEMK
jgi:hypothetical protein